MKARTRRFVLFVIVLTVFPYLLFSQSFEKSILIDIPGDNFDFDIQTESFFGQASYITWVNKNDSIYTVYLKRLYPEISDTNIVISSDNVIKSKPEVALNSSYSGARIVWENFTDNFFQIAERDYRNDSLTSQIIIQDSLTEDPQISLSMFRLAMIMNNRLYIKNFGQVPGEPVLIDSWSCSSPDIIKEDGSNWTQIIYERIVNENHQIYSAELINYPNPHWTYELVGDGDNRNPDFGMCGGISFETVENGIHKIKYSPYQGTIFTTTENSDCNYKNPNVFSYPIPTNPVDEDTPFFVAFDTDSLVDNNEIFIQTFFADYDTLMNISDMAGNDYGPKTACIFDNGINYAAIVWMHQGSSGVNIWMAKTVFNPIGAVADENININSFDLLQNYPNPFNPVTNIEYYLEKSVEVKVDVFDILGSHVATLADGFKTSGKHNVIFNGINLSSGIYFYSIEVNGMRKTKSMVLLR